MKQIVTLEKALSTSKFLLFKKASKYILEKDTHGSNKYKIIILKLDIGIICYKTLM